MHPTTDESPAVTETRLVHDVQRRATSDLVAVLDREPPALGGETPSAVDELRDFLVASLTHHHLSEDETLWPMLRGAAPGMGADLDELTREHERLDAALVALASATMTRPEGIEAAAAVRDLVHLHLSREEPILFPALRRHVSDAAWAAFSRRTVDSAPQQSIHLLVAYLHDVGAPDEVDLIFRHLTPEKREGLPMLRELGQATLDELEAGVRR